MHKIRYGPEAKALNLYRRLRGYSGSQSGVGGQVIVTESSQQDSFRIGNQEFDTASKDSDRPFQVDYTSEGQVQAWNKVAEESLVTDLVSSFLAYDACFLFAFIDRKCFLNEMRAGDVEKGLFCSPLLINAICAFQCVSDMVQRLKAFR